MFKKLIPFALMLSLGACAQGPGMKAGCPCCEGKKCECCSEEKCCCKDMKEGDCPKCLGKAKAKTKK